MRKKLRTLLNLIRRATARRDLLVGEDGPTAVEYAVMLALILLVCFGAVKTFGTATSTSFSNSATSISTAIGS